MWKCDRRGCWAEPHGLSTGDRGCWVDSFVQLCLLPQRFPMEVTPWALPTVEHNGEP